AQSLLVVVPVWFYVAFRLVVAGQGAYLGELRLECVNEQANSDKGSQSEQPDGFNVTGVVTEVIAQQDQYCYPTSDLGTSAWGAGPAEASRRNVTGGHAVVYLWRLVVRRHVLSLVLSKPQFFS